tara:strand:- start:65 stop:268 length:204 start_codon:yes stop_codon:yes gene_type:complete
MIKSENDYYSSGQDTEEARVFDVLTTVVVRVEADSKEDAESMVDRDLYCGDIDTWTANTAARVYEDK